MLAFASALSKKLIFNEIRSFGIQLAERVEAAHITCSCRKGRSSLNPFVALAEFDEATTQGCSTLNT